MFHVKHPKMQELIKNCPVCNASEFHPFLEVTDHFLSGELFTIVDCTSCGFKFINPRPDENDITGYYQSVDYISHDASKNDLVSKVYRLARHFSLNMKLRVVMKYSRKGTILDIGCGTGEFLEFCRKNGFSVTGMEPGEKAANYAATVNKIPVVPRIGDLTNRRGFFETITLWHVLEHIHRLPETIDIIRELLAENGTLVVAVPNYQSHDAVYYKQFWAAYDVPRHLYHFNRDTIGKIFSGHGFSVKATMPQKLDAYYVSLLSEKYRSGKNQYIKAFWRGFLSNLRANSPKTGHSSIIYILKKEKHGFSAI